MTNIYPVYHDMLIEKVKKILGRILYFDISGRNYSTSIFGCMVKFGQSVFYLLGRLVKYSAVPFSIYSAVWIRPSGQVR